jgi:hypothetical protein
VISFVDYRLSAPRDARLRLASEKSRQRPLLDRTHWPPLKASVEAGAFILPGLGVRALAASVQHVDPVSEMRPGFHFARTFDTSSLAS